MTSARLIPTLDIELDEEEDSDVDPRRQGRRYGGEVVSRRRLLGGTRSGLIASDNTGFALVEPVALAVGLCLAMIVLFGATFGVLVDRLAPRWPRPGRSVHGVVSVLPFGLLLPAPPLFVAAVIGLLVGTLAPRVRPAAAVDAQVRPSVERAGTLGRILVGAFGALGGLSVVATAVQVLAV